MRKRGKGRADLGSPEIDSPGSPPDKAKRNISWLDEIDGPTSLESSIKERHHDESIENIEGKRFRNRPPAITTTSPLGCSQITHEIFFVHLFVVLTRCPHSLSSLGNNPNAWHPCEIIKSSQVLQWNLPCPSAHQLAVPAIHPCRKLRTNRQ